MSKLITIEPVKTYASRENAVKAVEKKLSGWTAVDGSELRYFIMPTDDGRFFPVFLGEQAIQAHVHFHFNVVG